jgi:hypothetical protein
VGAEVPPGEYGFGLNEAAAGAKKGRSEVEVMRRFRARVEFVDEVPVNDNEALRVDCASDMTGDCDTVWIKGGLCLMPDTTLTGNQEFLMISYM